MEEQEVYDRLAVVETSLSDKLARSSAIGTTIGDVLDGVQEDPAYDEPTLTGRLSTMQTYLSSLQTGAADKDRLVGYAKSVGPYFAEENGLLSAVDTIDIEAEAHHVISEFGIYNMSNVEAEYVVLNFEEGSRGVLYFRIEGMSVNNILNLRVNADADSVAIPVDSRGWAYIVIHPADVADEDVTYGTIARGSLGFLPPIVGELTIGHLASPDEVASVEGALFYSYSRKGSGDAADKYDWVEVFGEMTDKDAETVLGTVPEGPAAVDEYNRYIMLSSKPATVNKQLGVGFSSGSDYVSSGSNYSSIDTVVVGDGVGSSKVEVFSYGPHDYVVTGCRTTPDGSIRLYKIASDGTLVEMSEFDSDDTIALHVLNIGTDIYIFNWNSIAATSSKLDVYKFNKATGEMASVGTTALHHADLYGVSYFRYNGKLYFITSSSVTISESSGLYLFNVSDGSLARKAGMESTYFNNLRMAAAINVNDNDGFPVIAGLLDHTTFAGTPKNVHYLKAVADATEAFAFEDAADESIPITTEESVSTNPLEPSAFYVFNEGLLQNAFIASATGYRDTPNAEFLSVFASDGHAGLVADGSSAFGNYHFYKVITIKGIPYLLAGKMGSSNLDLLKYNDPGAQSISLTVSTVNVIDAAYVLSGNKHLMIYTTEDGAEVEVISFEVDDAVKSWRSFDIDEDLL